MKLPTQPYFDASFHTYRHPVTGARLAGLTSVLQAAGIRTGGWYSDEQALLRGKRVHAATHFDDEGDLKSSSVLESDRGYLEAWRAIRQMYKIKVLAAERPCMFESLGMACTPDRICRLTIHGERTPAIAEIKSGTMPWWVRYQLAGQQMMMPDPFQYVRIAFELHNDGTWAVGGPWFPSSFAADRRVVEAALVVYRTKEEHKAL